MLNGPCLTTFTVILMTMPLGFFFKANQQILTDGSGAISWELMEEVAEHMGGRGEWGEGGRNVVWWNEGRTQQEIDGEDSVFWGGLGERKRSMNKNK